tara:strand:- start:243 stop:560 length:318 start_codon:yes stop_codon:yes gene_type:complete
VDQLVRPELLNAELKLVAGKVSKLKSVRELQLRHALAQLPAVGNGVLNEVSPLDFHALAKLTFSPFVPRFMSAGKEVREEQSSHALEKFVTLLNALLAAAPLSTK